MIFQFPTKLNFLQDCHGPQPEKIYESENTFWKLRLGKDEDLPYQKTNK
jgi:hypothetical protein